MTEQQQEPDTYYQKRVFFPNGYGASVVCKTIDYGDWQWETYGGKDGDFELAVLTGTEDSWDLCYNTPITSDVLARLSFREVADALDAIEQLPPVG